MKPDDELFGEALALPEAERSAFLARECGADAALRARIVALLAGHGRPWNYLETLVQNAAQRPDEQPGDLIGPYKLLQKIGEGGCGAVYMAEQAAPLQRRVALKVIKLGMDTREVIARFEAERQALALMEHPNIARVLDAGTTLTGRPYFAMELVRGVPITRYCDERNLSPAERLRLFLPVCHAVQHAHQKGIVHRDLKPSNILVTPQDGVAVPKVIDFGIAKAIQGRLTDKTFFTAFEQFIGTPAYMSPEQAELGGLDVDTRADIYSLGVLLYELLTGRTPFDPQQLTRAGVAEMRRHLRDVEPPPPSTRLGTLAREQLAATAQQRRTDAPKLIHLLRGDLDWVVMRCLEKDRRRRYETPLHLAQDLQRHLDHEPVLARPPSAPYRMRRLVRRHRAAFLAGGAVLAALFVGLGLTAWALARERAARLHARRLLYAADMNLAQQSLNANNLARARLLLDRHRPQRASDVDVRGWEWRYLWQQTRSDAVAELMRHRAPVSSIGFSRDGRHCALGFTDGRVELWDVPTRRRQRVLIEQSAARAQVAFSPVANALAITSGPGVLEWHDLDTGKYAIRCRLSSRVRDLAFSPDGTRLTIATLGSPTVHVVDTASGEEQASRDIATTGSSYFDGARLSPDATRIYFSTLEEGRLKVRCARLSDWSAIWEADVGSREGISALELSPDGRALLTATGFERDPIQVWDAATGARVATLDGHAKFVSRLAFSADGRILASASSDQTVRIWDTSTWRETAALRGHVEEVYALALSPDGKSVVSGAEDGTVLLWDATRTRPPGGRRMLPPHVTFAWALPGGQAVLAATTGGGFSVINLATLQETTLGLNLRDRTYFVPPNVFANYDGERAELFEVLAYGRKPLGTVRVGPSFEGGFAFHAGKRLFAWGDGSKALHVAALDAPEQRLDFSSSVGPVRPLNFAADGTVVRGVWAEHTGMMWNLETRQLIEPFDGWVVSDARSARIGSSNRPVLPLRDAARFRGFRSPDPRFRSPADVGQLSSIAITRDGRLLAAASETGFLALGDPANLASVSLLTGNMQDVDAVAFSPDEHRLATTSHGDEMLKLWDVETRQELLTLSGTGSEIYAVEFTDDGNTLLVGRRPFVERPIAGLCQFWTAPSWAEIAAAERAGAAQK